MQEGFARHLASEGRDFPYFGITVTDLLPRLRKAAQSAAGGGRRGAVEVGERRQR